MRTANVWGRAIHTQLLNIPQYLGSAPSRFPKEGLAASVTLQNGGSLDQRQLINSLGWPQKCSFSNNRCPFFLEGIQQPVIMIALRE